LASVNAEVMVYRTPTARKARSQGPTGRYAIPKPTRTREAPNEIAA